MACYTGQDTVANELVNCGANINCPNRRGSTPLHLAAASSSGVLCLELLVNNGADVTMQVYYIIWCFIWEEINWSMLHSLFDIMQIMMCVTAILNKVIDFFFNRIKKGRVLYM